MTVDIEPAPKEGAGTKIALASILSVCFFFGSYIVSTIISEVLGRRGLPGSPLIYAVVIFPLTVLLVVFEERIQESSYWTRIKRFWYVGIVAVGSGPPIVLTIFTPMLFWQSLPPGGPTGVAIASMIGVGLAVMARGSYAIRRHR
ncbi:hypothetical protein HQO24_11590 [Rhodococcus fascians]|uniref:hypothetical protein n=1 Tax=unclassified Rhodococcus (in: high G+C Gram-positive bacteria) TaxID=192944 RepID=UPI0011400A84|nr:MULTISPECIES: hypothetical protein [unclassified Rhodococcus (in: high G+C Gram-positive bacteria)]MBY4382089.1 hypothetical protein [Rhodococcus fascians]MBY4396958.1 hypothetical protein [Rhodococcus fascians]MBY4405778.1 hypothetical protein [Rhodococcus fascians]MBY4421716.1 hypothetical protein [Rhodococcus fascians]MBY4461014.1 hypothetical protein [Rhodococcus fascians]